MNNNYDFKPEKVKSEIIAWIADYFANAPADAKAVIGISGGKDSTVSAALCVEAIGAKRVIGVLMPQGKQSDIDVSYAVCKHLGIEYVEVNIGETVEALYGALRLSSQDVDSLFALSKELPDVLRFNTPARIRMAVLYGVAATVNGRVVNNCNLSETFVGWGTKFGDMAGDFSPIAELTVTEVKAVGRALGLPAQFIDKTPIDGLCGKSDEEGLGFSYDTLDKYIRQGICECENDKNRILSLHVCSEHKRNTIPRFRNSGK